MHTKTSLQTLTISALLIAIGIIIPMFSPFKLILEPASYTLGSHVAIFIAMMISPTAALAVALGTAMGFLLGPFPIVVVLRASTHLIFAVIGAMYIKNNRSILKSPIGLRVFSLILGFIHALCEICVVSAFYFGNSMSNLYYQNGFAYSVLLLVGVGTVIHSMIDFEIANVIARALEKQSFFAS